MEPFTVHVPDEVLSDLRERLARTRFPVSLGTGWERGVDSTGRAPPWPAGWADTTGAPPSAK